jgi:hypothetical protein
LKKRKEKERKEKEKEKEKGCAVLSLTSPRLASPPIIVQPLRFALLVTGSLASCHYEATTILLINATTHSPSHLELGIHPTSSTKLM